MMEYILKANFDCSKVPAAITELPGHIGKFGSYLVSEISDLIDSDSSAPKILGEGNFGVVQESTYEHAGKKRLAAKKVTYSKEYGVNLVKEIELQSKLNNPHIIKVFEGSTEVEEENEDLSWNEVATMTSEFAGHDLESVMNAPSFKGGKLVKHKALSPMLCENIKEGLLSALDEMSFHGIVHRDIKPQNILMGQDGVVKLGDFGLARPEVDGIIIGENTATAGYTAPEVFSGKPHTHRSDIFSVGAVLFEAHTGEVLFPDGLMDKKPALVRSKKFYNHYLDTMLAKHIKNNETALMLRNMLAFNPGDRPTTSDLLYSDAQSS